jgi:hypothetical protein
MPNADWDAARDSGRVDSGAGDEGARELRSMVFIVLTFTEQNLECKGKIFGFLIYGSRGELGIPYGCIMGSEGCRVFLFQE